MTLPSWLSRILVTLTSAVLVIALVLGGIWLTHHPIPRGGLMPVAMVAGLAAMVYGARKWERRARRARPTGRVAPCKPTVPREGLIPVAMVYRSTQVGATCTSRPSAPAHHRSRRARRSYTGAQPTGRIGECTPTPGTPQPGANPTIILR